MNVALLGQALPLLVQLAKTVPAFGRATNEALQAVADPAEQEELRAEYRRLKAENDEGHRELQARLKGTSSKRSRRAAASTDDTGNADGGGKGESSTTPAHNDGGGGTTPAT